MIAGLIALGAFASYVIASAFFWHNPHILHKKKKHVFNAMHISHRGGSAEGYENTLKNFQRAVDAGTQMLELDVRLTKDGKVVVFHDPDLKRLAGSTQTIAELEYDELPPLNPIVPIDTVADGVFSDPAWSEDERRIPLLNQVFAQFPTTPINIDVKDNSPELIEEVSDLIVQYKRENITVWGSFNNEVCYRLHKTNPNVGLFFSAKRVVLLLIMAFTGTLPFFPVRETHYEVFLPMSIKKLFLRRSVRQVQTLGRSERLLFWASETFLIWRPLINHLQKRGIHVYLWVANADDEYAKCIELGVNGIMTDYPNKLKAYLNNNYVAKSSEGINSE